MLISRLSDIILAFPVIVLYVVLIANVGPSALNIVVATTVCLRTRNRAHRARARAGAEAPEYVAAAAHARQEPRCTSCSSRSCPMPRAAHRRCLPAPRLHDHHHRRARLPRPRPAAAHPDWGGMIKESDDGHHRLAAHVADPRAAMSSLVIGFNLLADGIARRTQARDDGGTGPRIREPAHRIRAAAMRGTVADRRTCRSTSRRARLGLVGESGCGKSTLALAVMRYLAAAAAMQRAASCSRARPGERLRRRRPALRARPPDRAWSTRTRMRA